MACQHCYLELEKLPTSLLWSDTGRLSLRSLHHTLMQSMFYHTVATLSLKEKEYTLYRSLFNDAFFASRKANARRKEGTM